MAAATLGAQVFATVGELLDSLSNAELATVLDTGGSARRIARPHGCGLGPDEGWEPAWVDADGLWLDGEEPGYVTRVAGWEVDLPY